MAPYGIFQHFCEGAVWAKSATNKMCLKCSKTVSQNFFESNQNAGFKATQTWNLLHTL